MAPALRSALWLCVLAGLLGTWISIPGGEARTADPRLERFNDAYSQIKRLDRPTQKDWLGPQSPFAPYLSTRVVDGLGRLERALLAEVLGQEGDCNLVDMLGTIGFLTQHPFLTEAFDQSVVQSTFDTYVVMRLLPCCSRDRSGKRPNYACCEPCELRP